MEIGAETTWRPDDNESNAQGNGGLVSAALQALEESYPMKKGNSASESATSGSVLSDPSSRLPENQMRKPNFDNRPVRNDPQLRFLPEFDDCIRGRDSEPLRKQNPYDNGEHIPRLEPPRLDKPEGLAKDFLYNPERYPDDVSQFLSSLYYNNFSRQYAPKPTELEELNALSKFLEQNHERGNTEETPYWASKFQQRIEVLKNKRLISDTGRNRD